MCLTSIFDDRETVLASQGKNWIHVGHLAVEVHWHHCSYGATTPQTNEFPQFIFSALLFEKPLQHLNRNVEGALVYVDEFRFGASLRNCFRRSNKRMGHGENRITRLHSTSHNGEAQRVRTAANSNRMARITKNRECLLKLFHNRAADKAGCQESSPEHVRKFFLEFHMRLNQIEKWNFLRGNIKGVHDIFGDYAASAYNCVLTDVGFGENGCA